MAPRPAPAAGSRSRRERRACRLAVKAAGRAAVRTAVLALIQITLQAAAAPDLSAQASSEGEVIAVVGVVLDASSGAPVLASRIRLVPPPEDPESPPPDVALRPHEALTDSEGRFQMDSVRLGAYVLRVESLGYQTVERPVRVMGASPLELRVRLAPDALELEGVVVTSVRSPRLEAAGFYDRLRLGTGSFLTRQEIEDRFPARTSDLFTRFAGVQLQRVGRSGATRVVFRGGCRPDIVVDGLNLGPDLSVDDIMTPGDLEAAELYRGPGGPLRFSRSSCGAILLWSADPATRVGNRSFSWARLAAAGVMVALALLLTR